MSNQLENNEVPAVDAIHQLRMLREQMNLRFNRHFSDNSLSPETSLALRSHISNLTQMIEPGTKEMWPDYSAAEKAYMEQQALKHKRDANNIGIAALGLFSAPAILAGELGAPPETVSDFLELGSNLAAMGGVSKVGSRLTPEGAIEAVSGPKAGVRAIYNVPMQMQRQASNSAFFNAGTVSDFKDIFRTKQAVSKVTQSLARSYEEANLILDWLKQPEIERLGLIIEQYSDGRGQFLADLREAGISGKVMDGILEEYRSSPEGRSNAYRDAEAFEKRFVLDMFSNGELDPAKAELMVVRLQAGQYVTARDYAALEQIRSLAHADFVEGKVEDFASMAEKVKLNTESRNQGVNVVRTLAEEQSPYTSGGNSGQMPSQPPASPEPGYER